MTDAVYQCTECLTLGPRPAVGGAPAWFHDGAGGFRHNCRRAEAGPAPARFLTEAPASLALHLHDRLYARSVEYGRKVRLRDGVIAALLAEVVAQHAPPAWWALVLVVALVARALWGLAHAGLDFLLARRGAPASATPDP